MKWYALLGGLLLVLIILFASNPQMGLLWTYKLANYAGALFVMYILVKAISSALKKEPKKPSAP